MVPGRILQLLQGLVVDGAHAVVDKHAAQKHGQGKDPRVILRVTLGRTLGPDLSEFMHGNSFRHYQSVIFIPANILTMQSSKFEDRHRCRYQL